METNTILALAFGLVGLSDIAIARILAGKLPSVARSVMTLGGIAMLLASAAFAMRLIRV